MSTLADLQGAQLSIEAVPSFGAGDGSQLLMAIDAALAPPSPSGSPATIRTQAEVYARTATQSLRVSVDVRAVATRSLPEAWRGQVAETAAEAVAGLAAEVNHVQSVLANAAQALQSWAGDLEGAQGQDHSGIQTLAAAKQQLGTAAGMLAPQAAREQALQGVAVRITAAQTAQDAGTRTAQLLASLTDQARASQVSTPDADPLDAVVLANTTDPGGSTNAGEILSENQLARASAQLDAMSPQDQAAFEALTAGAQSPQEAAYLWKALAAGHSIGELQQFDAAIHPHGNDPTWLADHLTPAFDTSQTGTPSSNQYGLTYQGSEDYDGNGNSTYNQGQVDDCVAASTVIAQASLDPTVMLHLTTGGTANGDDSATAFQARLQQMYISNYIRGQRADGDSGVYPTTNGGLGQNGETLLANQDLGSASGTAYHYVTLNSAADRQAAIGPIEQAVDAGRPVPLDVVHGSDAHQLMIIAHQGDEFEIYNPWGYTTWVTQDQLVNSQLSSATNTPATQYDMNTAYGLELPQ